MQNLSLMKMVKSSHAKELTLPYNEELNGIGSVK